MSEAAHIRKVDGSCVISVNGQGHLPCEQHPKTSTGERAPDGITCVAGSEREAATVSPVEHAWEQNYAGVFARWAECDDERLRLKDTLRDVETRLRAALFAPVIADEIRMFADSNGSWLPLDLARHIEAQVIRPAIRAAVAADPADTGR